MKYALILLLSISLIGCRQGKKTTEVKPEVPVFTDVMACTLSEISYCSSPQNTIQKYMPGWKLIWNPVAINGNYAFVATDGFNYAVAIRGSLIEISWAAFDNWIYQDLNVATQRKWDFTDSVSSAKISQGSYEGWQNLQKLTDTTTGTSLIQILDSLIKPSTPLYITGHSLGGNLATVYASWLWTNFKNRGQQRQHIDVITFAAPAAGNAAFARDFNKKFPEAMRYENTNDIVPKFPVADKVGDLGKLYVPVPAASEIPVGYKFLTIKLSTFFTTVELALKALEISNGNSEYTQPCGNGKLITIPLSGSNKANDVTDWFAEAGYQHGVERYAVAMGAPVIK